MQPEIDLIDATTEDYPKVSVGVASYNRPDLLRRALESVGSQDYGRLEILISDNGSTDPRVREVIDEFCHSDSRIRCLFHPVNQGAFFNFRSLLNEASGAYFAWLADDDYWSPEFLTTLVEQALLSGAALTYGRTALVDVEISPDERFVKEMSTQLRPIRAAINFIGFDTDVVFYGLFKTAVGKPLSRLLCNWSVPEGYLVSYPFLGYNFVSYVFIYGILCSGGFLNIPGDKVVYFAGGRPPFTYSPSIGWRHIGLLAVYVHIHLQMVVRFAQAALAVGKPWGVLIAPAVALYLFLRRMGMIVSQRLKRSFGRVK